MVNTMNTGSSLGPWSLRSSAGLSWGIVGGADMEANEDSNRLGAGQKE